MHKLIPTLLLSLSINGCATESTELSEYEKNLQWVKNANPEIDAQAALEKHDFRFLAMALRGTVIPGIDAEQTRTYELKCGVRYMQGVTDAVHGEEHLKLIKLAHDYAVEYNTFIKVRCNP